MTDKPALGVAISTYDRVDDARINMEIIRARWSACFDVTIVHAFNGEHAWWPERYLEDDLISIENRGHFQGAVDLAELGLARLRDRYPAIRYAVHLSSDTWLVDPVPLVRISDRMASEGLPLASCAWGTADNDNPWQIGLALDFCVFDLPWAYAHGLLPLRYDDFCARYGELVHYLGASAFPERVLALRFVQALRRADSTISEGAQWDAAHANLCRLREREPVHEEGKRRMWFPSIGLLTHHDPDEKRQRLQNAIGAQGLDALRPHAARLWVADDLSYYNRGGHDR